ncbi:MAG TPA: helix-turn-helix domain-containing protein [Steroidobacteraceae bacterium]|nr:helix-turn-helix domain-containing protein [Steroidobacteraceae bacterium]
MDDLQAYTIVSRYHHGQRVGERDYCYRVVSGAVRQYAIQPDGRRQIIDLLLPGDSFGFEAPDGERFAAEAIVEGTMLASYPWRRLLADPNPEVAQRIRDGASDVICRLQRQLLVVGRVKAPEKVGAFLLELAERLLLQPGEEVRLPVSRYDIADYLAISVETVSRSITDLQHRGAIRLGGARQVTIINPDILDMSAAHH